MKNLKKVLALVLVFASLLGLATMASATTSDDYSDAASISHIEAVDVMSTIGVFDGISGAFSGESILTREQAAKIITYMILGKDQADALVASVAPYTDVARDRWSAGSIAYCKNQGILAGVGNGRFEPNGKLTGVAFAKMCLVALGYDPTIEGLTGSDWAVNTSKLAIASAGITDSLSQPSLADEMSREDACQMAFNTIQADMVDYENRGTNISLNGASVSMSSSMAKPVSKVTGWQDTERRDGNMYAEAYEQGKDGIEQFAEKYFIDLVKSETKTDYLGRPSVKWTYKADEIGTYVRNKWLVQSWTAAASKKEMYSAIGSSTYDHLTNSWTSSTSSSSSSSSSTSTTKKETITVNGYTVSVDTTIWQSEPSSEKPTYSSSSYALHFTVDGEKVVADKKEFFDSKSSKAAGHVVPTVHKDSNIGLSGNGVLTELYKNNNGDVWIAMINTYLVQATADYSAAMKRVNIEAMPIDDENYHVSKSWLPTYISSDDFDVSGVKEGDYLLLTVSVQDGEGHKGTNTKTVIDSVTQATLQTASVTEYTEYEYVTMGGTKYSYNRILGNDEKGESFIINSDATLVLDTYGYIMYVADAMNSSNFVYIDNYAEATHLRKTFIADAYFADGTSSEITVGKVDNESIGNGLDTKFRAREWWTAGKETLSVRIPNQQNYAHWFTFTKSGSDEYTLRTPSYKRYNAPQSALTLAAATADKDRKLIRNGTVRFMTDMADKETNCMSMYYTRYDTDTKTGNKSVLKVDSEALSNSYTEINKVKGNDKTIFVVKNADGDVDTYTGIANVPTITLPKGTSNYAAKVSWINRKDSEYASFVFVDVSGTKATVDDTASVADYMFTLKCTDHRTYVDGLDYWKYTVIIDGKEEERWISTKLVDDNDEGKLYKKVKEDSHGRITSGIEIGDPDKDGSSKKDSHAGLSSNLSTITQKGNALCIKANRYGWYGNNASYSLDHDVFDLYSSSKSNINLVIKNDSDDSSTADFLYDEGADYEIHPGVGASYVAGMLQDYKVDGTVYLVVTEDDGDVIDTLWIYVTGAKSTRS